MAHIGTGEDANVLHERKRNHKVIKQLVHWVEQLQVISENIKF